MPFRVTGHRKDEVLQVELPRVVLTKAESEDLRNFGGSTQPSEVFIVEEFEAWELGWIPSIAEGGK
jgi:hypothetical protein